MKIDHAKNRLLIDEQIRSGRKDLARHDLRLLAREKLPRDERILYAALARRAGSPDLGVRWLNPIVRPTGRKQPSPASGLEKAEYAGCLVGIGASEEALATLNGLDADTVPSVRLFRTFALVSQWDYGATIPELDAYIQSKQLTDYERLVGKTNLAAAHVWEGHAREAENLLVEIQRELTGPEHRLLLAVAAELSARNALAQRNWEEAERRIDVSDKLAGGSQEMHAFMNLKWRCFLRLSRDGYNEATAKMLHDLRDEATRIRHWETMRECDRSEAIGRHDIRLLTHLYYGTPYPAYRRRLLLDFGDRLEIAPTYLRRMGEGDVGPTLDLRTGGWTSGEAIKPGQVVHRAFFSLASDFYRPLRLASLHYRLYEKEYFNPHSSPGRVHRALNRLREWTEKARAPFSVDESGGFYRLVATGTVGLQLARDTKTDPREAALTRAKASFGGRYFSLQELSQLLDRSASSAQNLLKAAKEDGLVVATGKARNARYRFAA